MYRLFSRSLTRISINLIYKWCTVYSFVLVYLGKMTNRITVTFNTISRRALNTISIALVLSVLLSACGGGGGGGGGGETTPTPTPTPTLSVLISTLGVDEDFPGTLVVATAANATSLTVNQSTTEVITVVSTTNSVTVSNFPNGNGRTTLTITASSGTLSMTAQVVVTVNAVNDPPTLIVSSNSISTVGGFSPITINTTASDIEDSNLTFTVAESTTGVVTVTTSTNAIVLNTIPSASGRTTLTVSLVDSSGSSVTQTIVVNVTVRAGAAPVLMVSNNRISVQEDFGSVVIRTTATDSDSTTLTLTVTPSMRLVNVAISTRTNDLSTITLTAIANLNGTATLTFRATDDGGQTNSTEIVVVVAAVNDTPTLTVPTATLTVLEDFDSTNSVATFADLDRGDALTVTVTESSTGIVTVTTSASGVSVSAIAHRNGRTTLSISVSDGLLSSTAQVVVDVTPVNDPPVLTVSTSALTLSEDFGAFLIATTRTDIDSNTLTFTVVESVSGIISVSTSSAGVQLRSTDNISGVTTLAITISDGFLSSTAQVVVTVTAVNDTPILSVTTTALTLNEDFATTQLITVNRSDIENDTLTLSVAESISNIVRVSTSSAGIQVVRIANANGQTTLTITVSDGQASASTQVLVTVNAVNDTPTLTVSSNSISTLGGFSPITINTTASDVEDANISFTVIDANTGVVTVTTSAEAIVLNTIPGASGQTILTVRVVDSSGTTVTQSITVSVAITPSAAPVVTVSTNLISVSEDFGTSVIIRTTATDADATNTITVSVSASRPIVTAVISTPVNGPSTITNRITLTAIGDANGTTTLTVLASDSGGQSHSTEIVVVIAIVNDTPTITVSTPALTVLEDFDNASTVATFADVDIGDVLTVTITDSNTGVVTVTTSASGVSVAAIANVNGSTTLNILVSDGTLSSTAQVVVTVTEVNDPPALSVSTNVLTLVEDFATTEIITVSRSDIDSNTLTLTVAESATGVVTVTTTDTGIQVANITNANGRTTLTITLSDGDLTTNTQVVIDVTAVNDPPALSVTTPAFTLSENFATFVILVNRSDVDSNTLTLTVSESATGVVTVQTSTSGISVSSIDQRSGRTTLTITLSDGSLNITTQVVIDVTAVNDPPVLTVSTTALTLAEDFATVLIATTRTDIDSNTLTLTVVESTTGVVTVTTSDAGVSVTSIENINGRTTLSITLSDGKLSTTTQVVVNVTPVNDPPALSVSTSALTLAEDFGTFSIATTRTDIDSTTLTLTVAESTTGVVTVTVTTTDISVTSIGQRSGRTTLTITLSDSQLSTTTQVVIDVTAVNDPPTLSVTTTALTLNEDFATTQLITVNRSDIENDTLTFSVTESISNIVRVSTSSAGVQVVRIANASGQTTLTITVSDGQASVSTQVLVTVNAVNDPPTLTVSSNSISTVGGFSPISINTTASDVEDANISFTVINADTGVVRITTSTNAIVLNTISGASGQTTLTVRVVDSSGTTVTEIITVSVSITVSAAPVVTVSTNLISVAEDFRTSVMIQTTATDADGDTITVSVSASMPIVTAVISTPANGQSMITNSITLTAMRDANGTATLTVVARDPGGQSHSTEIVVVVAPVQDTPTINIPTATLTLAEDFGSTVTIATASDADGDTLNVSVVQSNPGIVTVTTSASGVSVSSLGNANGQTTLTITVNDGNQDTTGQVVVNVTPVNDPPNLNIPSATLTRAEDFTGTMTVATASDIDSTTLTITVIESSTGVIRVTTSSSEVRISSLGEANGITTLVISLSDGDLTTTAQVVVTVTPVNDPPTLSVSTTALTLNEDFSTTEVITVSRNDIDSNTLTLTVAESATGVVTVTTTDAGVQVSNIAHANGATTLTISLSDGTTSTSTQVGVTVTPVNDTPTLSVSANNILTNFEFSTITINVTLGDVEDSTLSFSVEDSSAGVVTITTLTNTILLSAIAGVSGQTTLTVSLVDSSGATVTQTISVIVSPKPNSAPVLVVSTNRIIVQEDFMDSVVIRTTATDAEGDAITLSVSSSARLVDFALSTPISGNSTLTNSITLMALTNLSGTSTLTVQATDSGGISTTEQIVVVVNAVDDPMSFTLSTSVVSLSVPGSQLDRIVNAISISNPDNNALMTRVTTSGDNIFSANPTPVVSFTTNALTTITTLTSTMPTAQLYFTIRPDQTGTATLTVHLTNLTGTGTLQQTMVVHVNSVDVSPRIAQASPSLTNLIVHGGRLYANDVLVSSIGISRFLSTARALGGHLINFNSSEEYSFVRSAASGLISLEPWLGMVLPKQLFPGELSWITHDSTIAYGYASTNGVTNLTVYPGHFTLPWNVDGVRANRYNDPNTVYNWIVNGNGNVIFLVGDGGEGLNSDGSPRLNRNAIYEFPQGLASSSIITAGSVNTIRLTGFDLNGDTISAANWSGIDSNGGTVNFSNINQSSGVQTVDMVYTAPPNFDGQTTVVVTLQTNGLSTTTAVSFRVTAAAFTLPTTSIVLIENSSQTIRNQQLISDIRIPAFDGTQNTLDLQWRVTHSGDAIFSTNPTPVVSFSTTDVVTRSNIGSTSQTAQLYFTIAPDKSGTATLTLQLTNLSNTGGGQQTMIVQVNPMNDVPPVIAQASQSLTNLIVQSGRLYANSATSTTQSISPFLTTARALGGHLININTIEEINFVRATTSGLISQNAWLGLVLPQKILPGELFWITNDSTTAYGYASNNGVNPRLYPGHFALDWHTGAGLVANRTGNSSTVFNWATYSFNANTYFLIDDLGDGNYRHALYEFPRGLAPANIVSKLVRAGSSVTIGLTGFDLNRDVINTTDWSVVATTGTTSIGHVSQSSGVQTMNLIYTAPEAFNGQTTVVVTLQVNGLMTTNAISFNVDTIPNITLSTYSLVLAEDFSSAVIGTTATDVGVSGVLPFTVIPSSTEIVTISTSASAIQLSAIKNVNGIVTLTVQTADSSLQTASTQVVVTVRAVNDPPTVSVSSDNVSITGQFISLTINTTASDIEEGNLPFSVTVSDINVVNVSIRPNAILLTPRAGGSGRTTLTVTTIDNNNATGMRTIAVNIIVNQSTTPVLTVSTNFISVQEDFANIIIRTTATDADPGTLTVTVRASTPLVNAVVVSTQSITLSAIENVFGTTTLFVSAFDIGGLSDSTEIVVVVAPINDTPTLTVSSQSLVFAYSENATPLVLTVSATDVEDGTLSYSVSTGQGVVNTIMTTNTLTLSRLGFADNVHQVLLTLRTTDTDGVSITTLVTVVLPPVLIVTTGIKTLNFVWSSISGATHYRLQSNPDLSLGLGFADLSTTGIVISPNSTNIRQTTAQGQVALHRYIPRVNSPFYAVGSCDATSCGTTFRHNEEMLTNAQLNSMIGHILPHNPGGGDRFGISVSMSGDGNTLAVGADGEDSKATGFNGQDDNIRTDSGATYVFRRSNGTWSQQAYLKASNSGLNDFYGEAISLSHDGNTIAIGARLESGSSSGINGRRNNNLPLSGAVYAYAFINGVWSQQAYIKSFFPGANDRFGQSVSLSADGNTLAVGAWSEDNLSTGINNYQSSLENLNLGGAGAVYTYVRNGIEWTPQAYIKASNTGNTDRFGYSVSLSDDGNTLVVGAPEEDSAATGINGAESNDSAVDSGAVYVFRFIGGTWVQEAYVKASNTNAGDRFGESVSLSSDGNTLAVSSNLEDGSSTQINSRETDNNAANAGAAYVFRFNSVFWSQQAYIKPFNLNANDEFGQSVSLSNDGNILVVGANQEDGSSAGVNGPTNNSLVGSGAAYVFEFSNGNWAQQSYVKAYYPANSGHFGFAVSLSGDGGTLAVGASGVRGQSGEAYLY